MDIKTLNWWPICFDLTTGKNVDYADNNEMKFLTSGEVRIWTYAWCNPQLLGYSLIYQWNNILRFHFCMCLLLNTIVYVNRYQHHPASYPFDITLSWGQLSILSLRIDPSRTAIWGGLTKLYFLSHALYPSSTCTHQFLHVYAYMDGLKKSNPRIENRVWYTYVGETNSFETFSSWCS